MKLLGCVLVIAVLLGFPACAPSSRPPATDLRAPVSAELQASRIATRYGMRLGQRVSLHDAVLPRQFDRLPWVQYQDACLSAGYDLRRHAGDHVTFAELIVTFEGATEAQRLCLILEGDEVIGAFVYMDGEVGGVYALTLNPWVRNPGLRPPAEQARQPDSAPVR